MRMLDFWAAPDLLVPALRPLRSQSMLKEHSMAAEVMYRSRLSEPRPDQDRLDPKDSDRSSECLSSELQA